MTKIIIEATNLTKTFETDVTKLQQLLRDCSSQNIQLLERLRKSRARVKVLREFLLDSIRKHDHCDDSWYCCPKCRSDDHTYGSEPSSVDRFGDECVCGADAWNAKVNELCN